MPNGIVFDSSGNMFVADSYNYAIRKITPSGIVSTFAGSTTQQSGTQDGLGTAALFSVPRGLAINSANNLYVADNTAVRKITPAGNVTTLGTFNINWGVAVDKNGNVYASEGDNAHRIYRITPGGVITLFAGSPTAMSGYQDGAGASALFRLPYSLTIDKKTDTLYVADLMNNCIRTIDMNGNVGTLTAQCGSGNYGLADGGPSTAKFYYPYGLVVDANGTLYVGDGGNSRVRVIQ